VGKDWRQKARRTQTENPGELDNSITSDAWRQRSRCSELAGSIRILYIRGTYYHRVNCFKDQFNLKGVDISVGYISWADKPASEDSTLVTLLSNAGAIPYVKTNVPASLMIGESVNNVFGRTVNPWNRNLTTGGSSGGESALVTFRGSFLGVGTDIWGGAIRHPCSFTGLYGLRTSHGRVSYQRVANTSLGQEAVQSCVGPMCRSPSDIRHFMSSLAAQEPWLFDPQSLPIPWRREQEVLPQKLCFGFGMGDGTVTLRHFDEPYK
jgi:amidase